jgi:outer membrane protein OmpA-like peptidoglycan-associated protein/tetratricopeptide (TPR) repeat protein
MKFKKLLFLGLCTVAVFTLTVPKKLKSDDLGKANKYYEKYDYQFAIEIYEKLLVKKPSLEVAQKLANCYRFTGNTLAAEKAYAKVLTFPGFDPVNYIHYGDVLKQNGKFEEAKRSYLMYGERIPAKADEAIKLANGCDAARLCLAHPDLRMDLTNEAGFNSDKSDFMPVAYGDGFIFASDRWFMRSEDKGKTARVYGWTGNPYLKLYAAEKSADAKDGLYKLSLLPKEINSKFHNGPATLSADGETMIFTRSGAVDDKEAKKFKNIVFQKALYMSTRNNGVWTEATSLPFNNRFKYSVQHPALSPDGNILYFASDMPGGFGGMDLYYSEKINQTWSAPINCGNTINTAEDEVFPFIRKDGKLYFSSRGHITIGGLDIFSANGNKNIWTDPENLKAPINSTRDDFGIYFFQDNLTGFISSNRPGGKGMDDIYRFSKKPDELFFAVEGKVMEKGTDQPVSGLKIYLSNKENGETATTLSAEDGTFRFDLKPGADYSVRGDIDVFFSRQEGAISTKGVKESTIFNVKFEVEKGEEAYLVRLKNIYYDFDKYNIRKDAEPELGRVLDFMNKTPNVSIELRAHTDSRGKAAYNKKLSEKRAESARQYLLNKGADLERLSSKGFGEDELLNQCADGVKCTEEAHQLNRRTEFKVVKVNPVLSYVPMPFTKY